MNGFVEDNEYSNIQHQAPILFGYNLIRQQIFVNYKGTSIAHFKPLESGFGSKVLGEYNYFINFPLSKKNIRSIIKESNLSAIINFDSLELRIKDLKVYDIVDSSLLLESPRAFFSLSLKEKGYYNSIDEFLNNIPKLYKLHSVTNFSNVVANRSIIAPFSLVYGFIPNRSLDCKVDMTLKTTANTAKEIVNNMNVDSTIKCAGKTFNIDINGTTKTTNFSNNEDRSLALKFDANVLLNSTIIKTAATYSKALMQYVSKSTPERSLFASKTIELLDKAIESEKIPPSNQVQVGIDANFKQENNIKKIDAKNLSLFFSDNGVATTTTINIDSTKHELYTQGMLSMYKAKGLINVISEYITPLMFKNSEDIDKDFVIAFYNRFLRNISNHPQSTSDDLVFDFEYSSHEPKNTKISNKDLQKKISKYYTTLYQQAIKHALHDSNFIEKLKQLIPDIDKKDSELMNNLQNRFKKDK